MNLPSLPRICTFASSSKGVLSGERISVNSAALRNVRAESSVSTAYEAIVITAHAATGKANCRHVRRKGVIVRGSKKQAVCFPPVTPSSNYVINAQTDHVGTGTDFSGNPTNQDLESIYWGSPLGICRENVI